MELQDLYIAEDHDSCARTLRAYRHARTIAEITRAELVEIVRRVMNGEGEEHEINLWLTLPHGTLNSQKQKYFWANHQEVNSVLEVNNSAASPTCKWPSHASSFLLRTSEPP